MTRREHEIHHCASVILGDLFRYCGRVSFDELCYLCECYHHPPLFDPAITSNHRAKTTNGEIILSLNCTQAQYIEVIPHELVHALADTPRWEYLNYEIEGWRYDRAAFLEAVASMVGKAFETEANHA